MSDILQVQNGPVLDTSITKISEQTFNPTNPNALSNNDIIHFAINQSDYLPLLHRSYFLISGRITVEETVAATATTAEKQVTKAAQRTKLTNGGILYLFNRAEVRIDNQTVESVSEPGLTCIPKIYSTFNEWDSRHLQVMGWEKDIPLDADGRFHNVIIPFRVLFGLGEDLRQVLVNPKIEILLTRSRTNNDAVFSSAAENYTLTLERMQYRLPIVSVDDGQRLKFLKLIEKDKPLIVAFRAWDLYQYPLLPQTTKHTWTIKTTTQLEKPRYAIVFFQTNRSGNQLKDVSKFDHCNLRNIKLLLNNEAYPYEDVNQSFTKHDYNIFYHAYCSFSSTFNALPDPTPLLDIENFKNKAPLFVIDCSRQRESLQHGPIDVKLNFESNNNFPEHTTAFCILIHDSVFEYSPLTSIIRKHEG